jgi:hypothetical protein
MSSNDSRPHAARPIALSDDEAVTLRRVAFGESDLRTLRRADLDRLRELRLIEKSSTGARLTVHGEEHFRALPRSVFASGPRSREGLPPESAPRRQPAADHPGVRAASGTRKTSAP